MHWHVHSVPIIAIMFILRIKSYQFIYFICHYLMKNAAITDKYNFERSVDGVIMKYVRCWCYYFLNQLLSTFFEISLHWRKQENCHFTPHVFLKNRFCYLKASKVTSLASSTNISTAYQTTPSDTSVFNHWYGWWFYQYYAWPMFRDKIQDVEDFHV